MTFLTPWALWVSVAVSAAVIALHILGSKNPRVTALPTTRFVPDVPLRATARALRLSDVLLMLLRVAVVMLVGVAVARPVWTRTSRAVGRVVMVDRWPASTRAAARDSAAAYYGKGDLLFTFDSAASVSPGTAALGDVRSDSGGVGARGSLSTALAAAMRAASSLRGEADSVEIVVVSSFASAEFDAATSAIRAAWPGRMRLVRLAGTSVESRTQTYRDVRDASPDDPVRTAVSFAAHLDTGRVTTDSVRIERGPVASADTSSTQHGRTLVRWPASLDSSGYASRSHIDTAGAVMAGDAANRVVVVSPFMRTVGPPPGRVVARWADGAPAATERPMMKGCVRDVAIPIPSRGDLTLRESTRRLVAALTGPCGHLAPVSDASDSALASLRGTGPLVATRALETRTASSGHLATLLLAAALVLLLLEPLLRRQRATA